MMIDRIAARQHRTKRPASSDGCRALLFFGKFYMFSFFFVSGLVLLWKPPPLFFLKGEGELKSYLTTFLPLMM